jgi:N-acetylmuramoyl-L-alanine amidase
MNTIMKNFVIPLIVLGLIGTAAYKLVVFGISRIKADPINIAYVSMQERERQLNCLADNIYYESAGENAESKVSVAQVTINRATSGKFPNDICRVVYQSSQFSWTISKPKSLRARNQKAYVESKEVAKKVLLEGFRLPSINKSLYYHTKAVNPVWNRNMRKDAVIGQHIFYSVS